MVTEKIYLEKPRTMRKINQISLLKLKIRIRINSLAQAQEREVFLKCVCSVTVWGEAKNFFFF
jgi:hypothetical protein